MRFITKTSPKSPSVDNPMFLIIEAGDLHSKGKAVAVISVDERDPVESLQIVTKDVTTHPKAGLARGEIGQRFLRIRSQTRRHEVFCRAAHGLDSQRPRKGSVVPAHRYQKTFTPDRERQGRRLFFLLQSPLASRGRTSQGGGLYSTVHICFGLVSTCYYADTS